MNNIRLWISLCIMLVSMSAKADTIDYWHLYQNQTKLKECNGYTKERITIKIKEIKKKDSLIVNFFCDAPCSDCGAVLMIKGGNKTVYSRLYKGSQSRMSISIHDLVKKQKLLPGQAYEMVYAESRKKGVPRKWSLVTLFID